MARLGDIEPGLTEEQQREYEDAFRDLDKTHTGFLSPFELGVLMRALGQTLTDEDMRNISSDNERCITLQDFLGIMAKREQDEALKEKLTTAFAVFDRDGSGFVSTAELKTQMMAMLPGTEPFTEAEFDLFMSEYMVEAPSASSICHPAEEDGLIDYAEFIKLMLRKSP
mmetsp:Transcript_100802/g.159439  ORF Transcript_100802/g.159439 Transcript_100802/m.159439 type:complete len:169 (-) Transcript_100802:174-680(-)|eukprot:CAMPEP_0169137328 /NCGR_PEP_ID=MMETSP1015-20121227/41469_1 /TAXON_ID=342587 /ORGANISM="Karlodinium micrum, Strain CCMP2283" /LENGTH=168 /DNA_ID=CAMNT_0009202143 /DNA_START=50 /DNA_END=556 /DNA_ORIENTATION=-